MSQGFLNVRTYTSDAIIPVENTIVLISTRNASSGLQLAAVADTNDSGLTETFAFTTPDLDESLSPNGAVPFLNLHIEAEHPGFGRIQINDVQIFPNTVSTQEIMLRPLSDDPRHREEQKIFNITPQNL